MIIINYRAAATIETCRLRLTCHIECVNYVPLAWFERSSKAGSSANTAAITNGQQFYRTEAQRDLTHSDDNRKISAIIATLLYVFGSCRRHSELTEET